MLSWKMWDLEKDVNRYSEGSHIYSRNNHCYPHTNCVKYIITPFPYHSPYIQYSHFHLPTNFLFDLINRKIQKCLEIATEIVLNPFQFDHKPIVSNEINTLIKNNLLISSFFWSLFILPIGFIFRLTPLRNWVIDFQSPSPLPNIMKNLPS